MKSAKTNQKTIVDRLRPDRTRNKYFKGAERKETILHSTDAIGWRPMEYYIPDRFQQFLSNLDSDIDTLISKAGPDRCPHTQTAPFLIFRDPVVLLKISGS